MQLGLSMPARMKVLVDSLESAGIPLAVAADWNSLVTYMANTHVTACTTGESFDRFLAGGTYLPISYVHHHHPLMGEQPADGREHTIQTGRRLVDIANNEGFPVIWSGRARDAIILCQPLRDHHLN